MRAFQSNYRGYFVGSEEEFTHSQNPLTLLNDVAGRSDGENEDDSDDRDSTGKGKQLDRLEEKHWHDVAALFQMVESMDLSFINFMFS